MNHPLRSPALRTRPAALRAGRPTRVGVGQVGLALTASRTGPPRSPALGTRPAPLGAGRPTRVGGGRVGLALTAGRTGPPAEERARGTNGPRRGRSIMLSLSPTPLIRLGNLFPRHEVYAKC